MRPLLLAVVLAFVCAVGAPAQAALTANPSSTKAFVDNAAGIIEFEIRAARVALKKTDNRKIDQYAKTIELDHEKAKDQLTLLVSQLNGVSIPTRLDRIHLCMLHRLEASTRESFERVFKHQQIEDRRKSIQLAGAYANHGENVNLKKWAHAVIPILKKHLAQAEQLPPSSG